MILAIIFWSAVFLIFHSYLLYPLLLNLLGKKKKDKREVYTAGDKFPFVSIIMSVHNEEAVLTEKIRSIYYTRYPFSKFEVLIGSDASTDGTNRICSVYSQNYEGFHFFPFKKRQGKPAVINKLVRQAKGEILILTDAKVFFTLNTIPELIKYFRGPDIGIVGGNIINEKISKDGISMQEKAFMSREIKMKYLEGLIWGKTMGIYGAVYAMRKKLYRPVPKNYTVDDFFISMAVLAQKKKAIINLQAVTKENVPNEISTEFRRKVRISAGNFQNLSRYARLLWPPWSSLSFAFLSHKVIRWIGPFLLLTALVTNAALAFGSEFYLILFLFQFLLLIIPFIDIILRKINLHVVILRFITHFYAMNLALLIGCIKNLLGLKTNIWQPTRR